MSTRITQQDVSRAKERSELMQDLSKGKYDEKDLLEEGAKTAKELESSLRKLGEQKGIDVVKDTADLLKANRKMAEDKELGERLARIANRLKKIQEQQENAVNKDKMIEEFSNQIDSLRSLLRLSVRSGDFRDTMLLAFRTFKNILARSDLNLDANKGQQLGQQLTGGFNTQQSGKQQSGNQQFGTQQSGNQQFGNQQFGNQQFGNQQFGNQQFGNQQFDNQQSGNQQFDNQQSGTQQFGTQQSGTQQFGTQQSGTQQSGTQQSGTQQFGTQQSGTELGQQSGTKLGEGMDIENIGKEVKEQLKETKKEVQEKWDNLDPNEQVISDQNWNIMVAELDNFFRQLNSHSEFRRAVKQLFSVGTSLVQEAVDEADKAVSNKDVEALKKETTSLIEQFAGEELHNLLGQVRDLSTSLQKNQEVQTWWKNLKQQVDEVAESYQGKQDIERFRDLFNQGRKLLYDYKPRIDDIIDSLNSVFDNISNDEYVAKIREGLSTLKDDLYWKDSEGNRYFNSEAAQDLLSSVGSVIKKQFQCLALPRVQKKDGDATYTFDNLTICAHLPDKIDFHMETDLSLDLSANAKSSEKTFAKVYLTAEIKGIAAQAKNVDFTYEGTAISDAGKLDVRLPRADLTLDFVLRPTSPSLEKEGIKAFAGPGSMMKYQFMNLRSYFRIYDLDINFHEETLSHEYLLPLLTEFFKGRIIDRFESGIESALDNGVVSLGENVAKILSQSSDVLSYSGKQPTH